MRILPTALVASVVIHTGAIAWALTHKIETPELVTIALPPIEVQMVPPPRELAVALLDDHTMATIPQSPTTGAVAEHGARSTANRLSTGKTHPETAPAQPKPPSSMMTMRHPEISKGVSGDFVDKFLDSSKPLQPKDIAGERIADDVATEAEHLGNPNWIANATPEQVYEEREKQVASRARRDGHELEHDGPGYRADHATFTGRVEPDGTAHIEQKRRYDPTEIIMNRKGIDPYASNKLRMLDDTRDERYEIGKQYKHHQLAQSGVIAQKNLNYLWAKTTELGARKHALFEMWDECAETGTDELVAGGTAARRMVVGFIRSHLTGDTAYTAAELTAFNANKKSSAPFDPYTE
jgi:hypothetical protein